MLSKVCRTLLGVLADLLVGVLAYWLIGRYAGWLKRIDSGFWDLGFRFWMLGLSSRGHTVAAF